MIPDGYNNVCELNEDVFEPLGAELHLHTPTGRPQMSARKRLVLNRGLAKLLGFARDDFVPGKTYIAGEPHRLDSRRTKIIAYLFTLLSIERSVCTLLK